ncbi:MAG: hypothetical protein LBD02_01925 [Christensenellaceae bacterium]|jgi:hypothetical protein|nr:hypothetical protein [Christensenellaceae bacterium]
MQKTELPCEPEALVQKLMGLYRGFREGSRMIEEKYARNHRLYLEQTLGRESGEAPRTGTPVLYATYRQELSDAMELIPEAIFLARKAGDEQRAAKFTALSRASLERMGFAEEYLRVCEYRARYGTGYTECSMDGGEPLIRAFDPRAIFPDPLCEDIQEGRALIKLSLHPKEHYERNYPEAFERMRPGDEPSGMPLADGELIPLLSFYLKERQGGKAALHLIKIAGGELLYDSRAEHPNGLYAHGEYPFVAWHYDRLPGTPWGFGSFDYLAPVQGYIDKLDSLVMRNLARAAKPRLIVSRSSGIDPEQLRDENEEIIEADRLDESALRWQPSAQMPGYAIEMLNLKAEMLKRESGENGVSRGESGAVKGLSGAAISMLQAAGSKRANLSQFAINNAFMRMVRQLTSNLIEHGDAELSYRDGESYLSLGPEYAGAGWEFDLEVRLQRMPQYQSVYQNQLLMQLVQMQVLPARAALELMDIEDKASILSLADREAQEKERRSENHAETEAV